jgi:ABC-type dipeptide/oligopeptide/nickel transport system ATPase component
MSKADNRRSLGKIISVTADRFVVELNAGSDSFTLVGFDGQHYVARIGSFILVPLQTEYVVAEVVGLRERELGAHEQMESDIEDTHALKAVKFLDIVPMGTLPFRAEDSFKFGVSVYPPLYSEVLYTQAQDLDRILDVTDAEEPLNPEGVDAGKPRHTRLKAFDIGTSVVFDDYTVKVRVDEFFGGHSAILGNTGSGKSCTVATIVQSIFEKPDELAARGASFVFFDTNGEYRQAFNQLPAPISRIYALVPGRSGAASAPTPEDAKESTVSFRLPHWYLSDEEWELLLRASDKAQRPVLRTALGLTSLFSPGQAGLDDVKNHVLASAISSILQSSDTATNSATRIQALMVSFSTTAISPAIVKPLIAISYANWASTINKEKLDTLLESHLKQSVVLPHYENRPFEFSALGEALDLAILYEEAHGNRHIRDYCSSMLTRFKSINARKEFQFMRPPITGLESHESSAELFVEKLLGLARDGNGQLTKRSQLTIVDMNEVEDEIVEVVSSVITRMIFERLRRAQNRNGLPVNLVLEEAHRYISDRPSEYALDATRIFERVAKEGRKYGLFITLASQRPSELSKTVLSQCSNFVVHRIQNPEDLQHVRRMTPFISESVLSRLPSLPKQHALIFGNSVNVPTTFRVRDASPTPKSDDAKIRETWFVDDSQIYTL